MQMFTKGQFCIYFFKVFFCTGDLFFKRKTVETTFAGYNILYPVPASRLKQPVSHLAYIRASFSFQGRAFVCLFEHVCQKLLMVIHAGREHSILFVDQVAKQQVL